MLNSYVFTLGENKEEECFRYKYTIGKIDI